MFNTLVDAFLSVDHDSSKTIWRALGGWDNQHMIEAQLFMHGSSEGVSVSFDALTLRFPASNDWPGAVWELAIGTSTKTFSAPSIEEISGLAERFDARVIDGEGICHGPFSIQCVICGYPNSTFCFLFHADAEGLWSGHTITRSFGAIVVVPYRTDPT